MKMKMVSSNIEFLELFWFSSIYNIMYMKHLELPVYIEPMINYGKSRLPEVMQILEHEKLLKETLKGFENDMAKSFGVDPKFLNRIKKPKMDSGCKGGFVSKETMNMFLIGEGHG